jgi:predicted metal-dependent peptidase
VDGALLLTTDVVYDYIRIPPIPVITNVQKRLKEGGTSFIPAFKWVSDNYRDDIDLFIYFTDAYGDYPENPPRYPVLWIVTTDLKKLPKQYYPPFGNVIQL